MNVSLTPELERLVIEKVESGVYQTASEVVGEALRLLKERDQAREQLRADVQAGFDQFASSEGRTYDMISGRQLAGRIKSRGRTARTKKSQVSYRLPGRTGPRGATDLSAICHPDAMTSLNSFASLARYSSA